jgi:hypothetical protein
MHVDPGVQADRCNRHGWGDTSLIKEDGYAGTLHPRSSNTPSGKGRTSPPHGMDGRRDLFEVLQQTAAG